MENGKETIEKIEQLVKKSLIVEVDGRKYSALDLNPVFYEPRPAPVKLHDLKGFCQFIKADIDDKIKGKQHLVVVSSHDFVFLTSNITGETQNRTVLVSAKIRDELQTFPFGRFMPQEEFVIKFRSLFVPNTNDDSDYVLQYTSKLVGGTEIDSSDDGITQGVTVKRKINGALTEKTNLKPIVRLTPWRTFRDVEQPTSEFLFRVRMNNDIPEVALFEADGGVWIEKAIENIVKFIENRIENIPVIA